MSKFSVMGGCVLVASLVFAADAHADNKVFHGGFCQPGSLNPDLRYEGTGLQVHGSSSEDVVCPLVRDNINASDNISSVWVELDKETSGTVTCTLRTQREDSNDLSHFDFEQETASGTGFKQLTFDDIDTFAGDESGYSVECWLRPGDYLIQITVNEQN